MDQPLLYSVVCRRCICLLKRQTPKSDTPPNIAPKIVTPENYLQICESSATMIGQLATVTTFGAILGGIPLSGVCPINYVEQPSGVKQVSEL